MTQMEKRQIRRMRWILFYTFMVFFVIITALTILAVFFEEPRPLGISIPEKHKKIFLYAFPVEIGSSVFGLFNLIFKMKKQPAEEEKKPIANVKGKYKYEEIWSNNKTVYTGECQIKQDETKLTVNGERKKECNGRKNKKVSVPWFSNWAELCNDNKIRMDFGITNGDTDRGYAILQVGRRHSKKILGEVHILGNPYVVGTIKLKRI